jgi:hypothetical protein
VPQLPVGEEEEGHLGQGQGLCWSGGRQAGGRQVSDWLLALEAGIEWWWLLESAGQCSQLPPGLATDALRGKRGGRACRSLE